MYIHYIRKKNHYHLNLGVCKCNFTDKKNLEPYHTFYVTIYYIKNAFISIHSLLIIVY